MRGQVARQAIQHLQAGRHQEALALLRERGKGSASLALLEHGFLDYAECLLCTVDAEIGCPVSADFDRSTVAGACQDAPRVEVGEFLGRSEAPPVSTPTQTGKPATRFYRRKSA